MRVVFELHDGWPPDAEPGWIIGLSASFIPCVLTWNAATNKWHGLRFTNEGYEGRTLPEGFRRGDDTEDFVVKWMKVGETNARDGRSADGGEGSEGQRGSGV